MSIYGKTKNLTTKSGMASWQMCLSENMDLKIRNLYFKWFKNENKDTKCTQNSTDKQHVMVKKDTSPTNSPQTSRMYWALTKEKYSKRQNQTHTQFILISPNPCENLHNVIAKQWQRAVETCCAPFLNNLKERLLCSDTCKQLDLS